MTTKNMNLDVDSPEKVVRVLEDAAQQFYDSAAELDETWQDESAGRPWDDVAKALEAAAARIEKKPWFDLFSKR